MKKLFIFLLLIVLPQLQAQVWFRINQVPSNTPAQSSIFAAGSFNNWNEASDAHRFTAINGGQFLLQLQLANGQHECKFTRGSWQSVEGTQSGAFLPNRIINVNQGDTIDFEIAGWEDLGSGSVGTALPTVTVLDNSFFIPQLNRQRRIWIHLPADYQDSLLKRYRVIYMHDGQNLFDVNLSFAGEWQVDEHLNELFENGDSGAIVIGIENGGTSRIDEYCPWNNPAYGGGEGEAYADFIANTLKPFIDSNFRTLASSENTAIAGSSLGALISYYTALKYPDVFGRVGLFSPAFWINRDSLNAFTSNHPPAANQKFYFVAGTNESSSMLSDMNLFRSALIQQGLPETNTELLSHADGAHSEWYWSREFSNCYLWLFAQSIAPGFENSLQIPTLSVWPNPADSVVQIDLPQGQLYKLVLYDVSGKAVYEQEAVPAGLREINLSAVPAGKIIVSVQDNSGRTFRSGFIKR